MEKIPLCQKNFHRNGSSKTICIVLDIDAIGGPGRNDKPTWQLETKHLGHFFMWLFF